MGDMRSELLQAWAERHDKAIKKIAQASKFPAFFTSEYVEDAEAERDNAVKQYLFWEKNL